MERDDLVEKLKEFLISCYDLRKKISEIETVQVTNKELRGLVEQLSIKWFDNYSATLNQFGLDKDVLEKYNKLFKNLLKLSGKNNRTTSFVTNFNTICKSFREDVIIFMQIDARSPEIITENEFNNEVSSMLAKVPDKDENEYLKEALGCWKNDYMKAAVVLAWCAAIDRIHRVIEKKSFKYFNETSEEMKAQKKGRFKKFNKNQNVQSISDLRRVFDSDILWILEGMKMIDSNQKTRLSSCFDMRCHSGHPGSAPITKYNVLSCFSDIIEIILANPIFSISKVEDT